MSSTRIVNRVCRGVAFAALVIGLTVAACGGSQPSANGAGKAPERVAGVAETIARFKQKDSTIDKLFADSAGYVVLPSVGEGGFIVGGGHGHGEAFAQGGTYVGRVTVSELSIGAQVGGQSYSQVIFFETPVDFERLKKNSFQFTGEVLAVAADHGAARNGAYKDGVMTFIIPNKGLMASAAVGGQKLDFTPAQ
jgi:lipid-binding SYLF domain-containing protein